MAGEDAFDLLVIGGGINGAGIARDAAMRGLSVCLVEQEDWGSGTSARSSMLAHGGLRYLEAFELGLVHEALQDREIMFRHAPHLVRPLQFIYPLYPHIASRRTVRVGMWLYDVLSHGKSVPRREYLHRDELLQRLPGVNPDGLIGGATYYDGQWRSVERFVNELVIGARRHGAVCLHHTRITQLAIEDDACTGAWALPDPDVAEARSALEVAAQAPGGRIGPGTAGRGGDEVPRRSGEATQEWRIRARLTINAAGPWVDAVLRHHVPSAPLIRGTKGSHIVVPRFIDTALIIRAKDGRAFFILPWLDHCVIGTTDTDFTGDPAEAVASPDDVQYLQESARWYFPDAPLDEVQWTYAGVRPLVHEAGLTESNVTRRHRLHDHARDGVTGVWSIQGGKLTTYRHLSEETVDKACRVLGRPALGKRHPTRTGSLPGGPLVPWEGFRRAAVEAAMAQHRLAHSQAAHLVDTYGARWRQVADAAGPDTAGPDGLDPIVKGRPWLWCEVDHAVRHEQAVTLRDVMLRRTQLGLARGGRPRTAKRVARRMGRLLGWRATRVRAEVEAYAAAAARLRVPAGSPRTDP